MNASQDVPIRQAGTYCLAFSNKMGLISSETVSGISRFSIEYSGYATFMAGTRSASPVITAWTSCGRVMADFTKSATTVASTCFS